ncbi:MAG: hypothetical protein NTZ41_07365, partial [Sphingobacteriales bacterium]|nr:hypothetical protein [Sphingobacteriales bacterium]
MDSKKVTIKFLGEILVNKGFVIHVMNTLIDCRHERQAIFERLDIGESSYYYFAHKAKNITNTAIEFVKLGCELIHVEHRNEFTFNKSNGKFERRSNTGEQRIKNGVYYGYFKAVDKNEINHFLLLINVDGEEKKVRSWAEDKVGEGDISFDVSTFAISLAATTNSSNKEFLIGKYSEDHFMWLIASWRDRQYSVYSTICLIQHEENPPFKGWIDIEANQQKIKEDMIKKMPKEAEKLLDPKRVKL